MKILRVVGFGLAIVMLKFLVPRIFLGFESTVIAFLKALENAVSLNQESLPASVVPMVSGL